MHSFSKLSLPLGGFSLLLALASTQACASDDAENPDADQPAIDAGNPPARPDDGGDSSPDATPDSSTGLDCKEGPKMDLARARQLSIEAIRAMLGVSAGLDDGKLWYRDGVTALEECPRRDQSMVAYVAPLPANLRPAGLPEAQSTIVYEWGLNGIAVISFRPSAENGILEPAIRPLEACAILKEPTGDADRTAQAALIAELQVDAGTLLTVNYLDQIGIVCWEGPQEQVQTGAAYAASNGMYAKAGSSAQVTGIERGSQVYKVPENFEIAVPIADEPNEITPECLRTTSRRLREEVDFASLPSLPAPFGPGWQVNAEACLD